MFNYRSVLQKCFCLFLALAGVVTNVLAESDSFIYKDPQILPARAAELNSRLSKFLLGKGPIVENADARQRAGRFIVQFSKSGLRKLKKRAKVSLFRNESVESAVLKIGKFKRVHTFASEDSRSYVVNALEIKQLLKFKKLGYADYTDDIKLEKRETLANDTNFNKQWALKNTGQAISATDAGGTPDIDTHATIAWDTIKDSSVVVAVADTGLDVTHPDFSGNIWTNNLEIPANGMDEDNNGVIDDVNGADVIYYDGLITDAYGHGTAVAGIIGAKGNNALGVTGMAWQTKLLMLKTIDDFGDSYITDFAVALNYATSMKNRFDDADQNNGGANIKIFNMSMGLNASCAATGSALYPTDIFLKAARKAGQAGILIVGATSNNASNHDQLADFPTTCDLTNLITVANLDRFGNLYCKVPLVAGVCPAGASNGSSYGATTVDIAAPGDKIYSTSLNSSYNLFSGTSYAAPQVSGVASLIASINPNLTPETIRNILLSTSTPLASLNGKVVANGMLDARAVIPGVLDLLPQFTQQPTSLSLPAGNSGILLASASGSNVTYEWYKDNAPIPASNSTMLNVGGSTGLGSGLYYCKATNQYGTAQSNPAQVSFSTPAIPIIVTHPSNVSVVEGQSVTFSCAASGTPLPTYQWQKSNQDIPNATSPNYSFNATLADKNQTFRCIASNINGSAPSSSAVLTVTPAGDYDRNGCVDGADYMIWQRSLTNTTAPYFGADGSGNGVVDSADYAVWRDHFGNGC